MKKVKAILVSLCVVSMMIATGNAFAAGKTAKSAGAQDVVESAIVAQVNLNSADEETLTNLPGIGPKTATRIHEYRQANGPFKSVDDLLKVKGIGPKVLEKIKPHATVS